MINTMEIPPEELPALDLFQNCRLCLAKEKVSVDIFSEGHEVRVLYYKIMSCLPVHVTQDDKLPRKICTQCNEKVDNFYQFWTLTAKTQKTLLDWSEKKDSLPAIKIKTENVAPPGEVSFKQETMDYSDDDNDRYDDDQSEDDLEPTAMVKVCEETDENPAAGGAGGAAGTSATTVKLYNEERMLEGTEIMPVDEDHFSRGSHMLLPETDLGRIHRYFSCNKCDEKFKHKLTLQEHVILKHGKTRTKTKKTRARRKTGEHQCTWCPKAFSYPSLLNEHMSTHSTERAFACPICQKRFKKKHAMTTHCRVIHQGKKYVHKPKYKCKVCPKAFVTSNMLNDHTAYVHQGRKSNICEICSASYIWKTSLFQHIRMVHDGIRHYLKNVQCELCGKEFKSRQGHTHHMNYVHGDAKPTCHICGKKVCSKEFLAVHLNMHTGEKPFSCEYCGKAFTSKKTLEIHVRTHTGETPFKCLDCPKAFKQRAALTGHYKSRHPGVKPPCQRHRPLKTADLKTPHDSVSTS